MMKKLMSSTVLILFLIHSSYSQKSIRKEESPPLIDPISNCQLRYYYYPNLEAYYDTQKNIYYYKENSEWVEGDEIPEGYRGYSLYNKIFVYINDYDDDLITQFVDIHKKKFPYTKKGNIQILTDSKKLN
jgi:hypothetical protein